MKMKNLLKLSAVLLCTSIVLMSFSWGSKENKIPTKKKKEDLTQFVDPFIGSGGHGHVFVGASVPFGGIQLGPTNFHKGWDWTSGYHYSDSIVKGFSHLHLSGTGIPDLGELTVMPTVGDLIVNAGSQENHMQGYASLYRKENEKVSPGYYKVDLERYDIKVELTATTRTGMHKYTFPESKKSRIIVDLGEANADLPTETYIKKINDTTFEGYRFSKGWAADEREFFTLIVSKPVKNFMVYDRDVKKSGDELKGEFVKGILEFETEQDEVVYMKMGVSPVSSVNGLLNLKEEIPHWNFDKVLEDAKNDWNKELSKIKVETKDEIDKRVFYTAMYHSMIAPNVFNDVNGEYRGADKKVYTDPGFTNYTLFSLWDTYRAAHPLYTITQPERVSDIVNSMLLIYKQQGKLPVWHLRGNETNTMPGYSAVPVIVDACLKGFENIDLELAYEAVKTTATGDFEPGVKDLMKFGYIPADHGAESVASSMEYAISDWAISKLAEKLGKTEDANYFAKRAKAYQEYFDEETGFMRGKLSNGEWRTPFDPVSAQHRVNDYCEGNAWQYLWMVPQDPEGLIDLLGSDDAFVNKLDQLFTISSELDEGASIDITGMIGQYAHGNEPSHATTYMYAYAGAQYKTADKVDYILNNLYTDKPDGLSGNEDCGQMSAWYILSSLGFYSVNPANGMYVFGRPLFDKAEIQTTSGKDFVIKTIDNSNENMYIQSVKLNGKKYAKSFITHKEIMDGGKLEFVMGPNPNPEFGNQKENRPQSILY